MRISDWSSDVCSSDLLRRPRRRGTYRPHENDLIESFGRFAQKLQCQRVAHRISDDMGAVDLKRVHQSEALFDADTDPRHDIVRERIRYGDRKSTRLNSSN